jgi:hypothetical protein
LVGFSRGGGAGDQQNRQGKRRAKNAAHALLPKTSNICWYSFEIQYFNECLTLLQRPFNINWRRPDARPGMAPRRWAGIRVRGRRANERAPG